jgi:4-amino-4-deoxy-L-arabinose transferase-like glycosyltransferase
LAGLLAALLIWRIGALWFAKTELFFDEAQYWYWSTDPAFGYYSKPPFIAWVIAASTEVCGSSEFCVRLPSPILHTVSALFIFAAARRIYDARTGIFAALAYATLPAVSLSSGVISTDVPLLLFWAAALYCFVLLIDTRSWGAAVGLGVALGLGALSKYAMLYFVLCAAVYALWSETGRRLWRDLRWYLALAIGGVILSPNIAWNIENKFATFSHTADNARLDGPLFNVGSLVEFAGAQFGVMGPVLFAVLLMTAFRGLRHRLDERDRMLLCFSLPILALISAQAFLSRAHANWAAVAYVAATILVIAVLLRANARRALLASFGLHTALVVAFGLGLAVAQTAVLPFNINPFERVLGWRELGATADRLAVEHSARSIAADKRALAAELNYYSRAGLPVKAWNTPGTAPRDHFEMTKPVTASTSAPILFVAASDRIACVAEHFGRVESLGRREVAAGAAATRAAYFYLLHDPRPEAFTADRTAKPGCRRG